MALIVVVHTLKLYLGKAGWASHSNFCDVHAAVSILVLLEIKP